MHIEESQVPLPRKSTSLLEIENKREGKAPLDDKLHLDCVRVYFEDFIALRQGADRSVLQGNSEE